MRVIYAVLALAFAVGPARAQPATACGCASVGPYPCTAATVVALADQAGPLGLSVAQADDLRTLRDDHLNLIHEILGDLKALREAIHALDQPFETAEVVALLYDMGRHEAELDGAFQTAEAALLQVLDDDQRDRWTAILAEAMAFQETPDCEDAQDLR